MYLYNHIQDKYDFFNREYKYLDKNYKIKIDSSSFNKALKEFEYIPNRIDSYSDSLSVVLMTEFRDWKIARIAHLRLTYSWERVSFHTRLKVEKLQAIASRYNISYPYKLQELFYDPKNNIEIKKIIEDLRKQLYKETANSELNKFDNYNLLRFSFNNNPDVIGLKNKAKKF